MVNYVMPTLSDQGWVSDPTEKMDFLLCHFFGAEHTQTYFFKGHIVDLKSILHETSKDPYTLNEILKGKLEAFLKPYFDHVRIETTITINDIDNYAVLMEIGIHDNNDHYLLNRRAFYEKGKFMELTKGDITV